MASDCEYCQNKQYYINDLERRIDTLSEELRRERSEKEKAQGEANQLRPYKRQAERAYDNYITNPERQGDGS